MDDLKTPLVMRRAAARAITVNWLMAEGQNAEPR